MMTTMMMIMVHDCKRRTVWGGDQPEEEGKRKGYWR
jgi:hypothetical protein